MKYLIIVLSLVCLCDCGIGKGLYTGKSEGKDNSVTGDKARHGGLRTYRYEDDSLMEILKLRFVSKDSIYFSLLTVNKSKHEESRIAGYAICPYPNGDPEVGEDDQGFAYPARSYYLEKDGCELEIMISLDPADKVSIGEVHCERLRNKDAPFETGYLLRLVGKHK